MKKEYGAEIKKLEKEILKDWDRRYPRKGKEHRRVSIETWGDLEDADVGLRIAEISFSDNPGGKGTVPMSGSSFMQSDTSLGIFAAERLILERVHFGGEDEELYRERLMEELWAPSPSP